MATDVLLDRFNMEYEQLAKLAEKAKAEDNNDLAIVLYTYLGSEKLGMSSDFARYCQVFAREGIKEVKGRINRRN
jgi:wyosine [tRNA(Phe)-imidazoG37] synthetase (radical SAM superfamily)